MRCVKIPRQEAASLIKAFQEAQQAAGKSGPKAEYSAKTGGNDPSKPSADAVETKKDRLDLSSEAQALQRFLKAVEELPDVREERINAIKDALRSGSYRVSGKQVVDKMMRELGGTSSSAEQGEGKK